MQTRTQGQATTHSLTQHIDIAEIIAGKGKRARRTAPAPARSGGRRGRVPRLARGPRSPGPRRARRGCGAAAGCPSPCSRTCNSQPRQAEQRQAIRGRRPGSVGGGAALTWTGGRRARCGARGGCPRRGRGCSGCGPASAQTWLPCRPPVVSGSFARRVCCCPRPRGWVWWCRWRLANCEVATGERCENTAEGGPRLYTRHAACNRSPWRPVRGRVAGGVGATIAYVCVRVTVWCDPARQAAGAWVPAEAVSGSSQGLVSFPGVA